MKLRTVALALFVSNLAILIFIFWTWYRVNRKYQGFDNGVGTGGIFALAILIATIYYICLTAWSYSIYKKLRLNQAGAKLQFAFILIICIMSLIYIIYKTAF